jgi:hypothetical protein
MWRNRFFGESGLMPGQITRARSRNISGTYSGAEKTARSYAALYGSRNSQAEAVAAFISSRPM